jgi:hypothetical protein
MSELPIADLSSESQQVRMQACTAIADSVDAGNALGPAVDPVIKLLADANPGVVQMAKYILQTDAEKQSDGLTVAALRSALTSDLAQLRREAAALLAGYLARKEDGAAVAELLRNPDQAVRLGTLKALADGALPRAQTDDVIAALAKALEDSDINVRKEATWALYLFASDEGVSIEQALPPLEPLVDDPTTQGNAAIALSLGWHLTGQGARADALYARGNGAVQMGVSWGAADALLRRGDVAALKSMFAHEDTSVRRGLGAYLWHARQRRRDISVAGTAFTELMQQHADDAPMQARLYGVQQIIERGPDA